MPAPPRTKTRILGIDFFHGSAKAAVERMRDGGLLVVPAAPALKDLDSNVEYRAALLDADLALTDSAFMVMIWNRLGREKISRLSGLAYLSELLQHADVREAGQTFWIMAGEESAARNLQWLEGQGIPVPADCVYLAPVYRAQIEDQALLQMLQRIRPQHIVVTIGGGTQERLGLYLKQRLSYSPAIHCIGAAIAFLSGDQVRIPMWADRFYIGWLFRSVSDPKRYVPRYWAARKLLRMMMRDRDRLPALQPEVVEAMEAQSARARLAAKVRV